MPSYSQKHRCVGMPPAVPWHHCRKGLVVCCCVVTVTTISGVRTVPFVRLIRLGFTWNTLLIVIRFKVSYTADCTALFF